MEDDKNQYNATDRTIWRSGPRKVLPGSDVETIRKTNDDDDDDCIEKFVSFAMEFIV